MLHDFSKALQRCQHASEQLESYTEPYHIFASVAMEEDYDWGCSAILTGIWEM